MQEGQMANLPDMSPKEAKRDERLCKSGSILLTLNLTLLLIAESALGKIKAKIHTARLVLQWQ